MIATCTDVPVHALADDHSLVAALDVAGYDASLIPWDDPKHDWRADDLVVIRSTWDYTLRREAFLAWTRSVPRLLNSSEVVEWNTDKRYLQELADAGIPIVPTSWSQSAESLAALPDCGEFVIKPTVSAGARDTRRFGQGDRIAAQAHLESIVGAGKVAMIQPYVTQIETEGETALVFIGGRFSHAMRKGPLLKLGAAALNAETFAQDMSLRTATPQQRALAESVLALVPGGPKRLLYARVDVVPSESGEPMLIELEVTEPSLFLTEAPGTVDTLVAAIGSSLAG